MTKPASPEPTDVKRGCKAWLVYMANGVKEKTRVAYGDKITVTDGGALVFSLDDGSITTAYAPCAYLWVEGP